MMLLDIAVWLSSLPVLAILAIFVSEAAFGILPLSRARPGEAATPRIAILIPAHNEAQGIAATLERLKTVLPAGAGILVVADNCSDDTAERARVQGVTVAERNDGARRGKGYALDFGRAALATSPPDAVIVLDADCVPEAGSVEALGEAAMRTGAPVQSVNLMRSPDRAGPMVEISNFAFMIKNLVRQRGLVRTGGPAMLTGTGMAFPWPLFCRLPLASANIVEDLAITITLTREGIRPRLVEEARVWSDAAAARDTLTQRTRWEHGFLATARRLALPTLWDGVMRCRPASVRLGLHLLVPPLALLMALGSALLALLAIFAALGGPAMPAIALLAMMMLAFALLALAWWREGRALLSPGAIARIPLYILWKLPVYLKLMKGAESEWVRTRRPD